MGNHWLEQELSKNEALKKYGIYGQEGYFFSTSPNNSGYSFWHPATACGLAEILEWVTGKYGNSWKYYAWRSVFNNIYVDWQPIQELHLVDDYGSEILWTENKDGRNVQILKGEDIIKWNGKKSDYLSSDEWNKFADSSWRRIQSEFERGKTDSSSGAARNYKPIEERYGPGLDCLREEATKAYDLGYDGKMLVDGFAGRIVYFRFPWYTEEQVERYRTDPLVSFAEGEWEEYYGENRKYRKIKDTPRTTKCTVDLSGFI